VEALITQTADQKIKPSRELFARQNRVQCERAFTGASSERADCGTHHSLAICSLHSDSSISFSK